MTDRELIEKLAVATPEQMGELIRIARRKVKQPPDELEILLDRVCRSHRKAVSEVKGKSKKQALVNARADFIMKAFKTRRYTGEQIGNAINRDNSTVLHHRNIKYHSR